MVPLGIERINFDLRTFWAQDLNCGNQGRITNTARFNLQR